MVELVEHQIGTVPENVRDVVDLVAVAEPIDLRCLAELVEPLALEETHERVLIRTTDAADAVYVGHPMYAEVRLNQCGPLRLRRIRGIVAAAMSEAAGAANCVRRGLLWLESDLAPDPRVLAAAASSLRDFKMAERLSRAAADAGDASMVLGSRSRSSTHMRSAVFLPTPGIAVSRARSLRWMAPTRSPGLAPRTFDSPVRRKPPVSK